jgi:hypothetical protein
MPLIEMKRVKGKYGIRQIIFKLQNCNLKYLKIIWKMAEKVSKFVTGTFAIIT